MAQGARKAGGGLARPVHTVGGSRADHAAAIRFRAARSFRRCGITFARTTCKTRRTRREIMADDKLKKVFGGKDRVSMFEMNKHLSNHLK